jgi:hypothetical protein
LGETEDDLRWRTDILVAIEREKWQDAQVLLLAREARTADAFLRLLKERDSLLDAWRLRLHGLPERDSRRLVRDLERMTFGSVKDAIVTSQLANLRKFLNAFKDILVKLAGAFLFAAPAAIAHHLVAAQIDRAFDGWLWQYAALVAFILAYRMIEKPLEGALEKRVAAIRRWGLRTEARGAYVDAIMVQQMAAEMSSLRARLTSELHKDQQ